MNRAFASSNTSVYLVVVVASHGGSYLNQEFVNGLSDTRWPRKHKKKKRKTEIEAIGWVGSVFSFLWLLGVTVNYYYHDARLAM